MKLLGSLGGRKIGETVKLILQKLGTNRLWSNYSLKGKRKKKALVDHEQLYKAIISKCICTKLSVSRTELYETILSLCLMDADRLQWQASYTCYLYIYDNCVFICRKLSANPPTNEDPWRRWWADRMPQTCTRKTRRIQIQGMDIHALTLLFNVYLLHS